MYSDLLRNCPIELKLISTPDGGCPFNSFPKRIGAFGGYDLRWVHYQPTKGGSAIMYTEMLRIIILFIINIIIDCGHQSRFLH